MATKLPPSLAATDGVQYIIRKQAEIEARVAALELIIFTLPDQLDHLAEVIGYPIPKVHETRAYLREMASTIRAQMSEARHG